MVSNKQKSDDAIFQDCIQFHQSGDFEKAQKGFEYLFVQVSGQNSPIPFHKSKLWLFKFVNAQC